NKVNKTGADLKEIPAGINLLGVFYVLLFFFNVITTVMARESSHLMVLGYVVGRGDDIGIRIFLTLMPLVIFYFLIIRMETAGSLMAIIYQALFAVNSALCILKAIVYNPPILPIIEAVRYGVLPSESPGAGYIAANAVKMVICAGIISYLLYITRWYRIMSKLQGYNQRGRKRWANSLNVVYWIESDGIRTRENGVSEDISTTGIRIKTEKPMEKGTEISIELTFPGHRIPIMARGAVTWNRGNFHGVKFIGMDNFDKKRLTNMLKG
ncbi:MAG: PilZ domain-containing protein, partial [Candidatus Omnitrophota bacterium]